MLNHPDRLFPIEARSLELARSIYDSIKNLPIICPHGHCDPRWFAQNEAFANPAELFVIPDHYVFRMLVSQGISMADLGVPSDDGSWVETDPKKIWQRFAENYHLFRGTPSMMWLDHSFEFLFELDIPLSSDTAEHYYKVISERIAEDGFRPRRLFDQFNIEVLSTTDCALDDLQWHKAIQDDAWQGRVIPTYRPDKVIDPDNRHFTRNVATLGELTGEDSLNWRGYLKAHQMRRAYFKEMGATATDHGHPSARTECLTPSQAEKLFSKALENKCDAEEADAFRGQMLTEFARMSLEDGLTMQIHPGSFRNHNPQVFHKHGWDKGFDMPSRTDYVHALKPMLDEIGMRADLTVILFTLDESSYARELAPLAGAYPSLKLGPPWWFFDSYEGMTRFRTSTTETCGFYNTAGFNDDTRAFCSIPARHDVARRTDCAYLATLVRSGRLRESEAFELATELTSRLPKQAYNL